MQTTQYDNLKMEGDAADDEYVIIPLSTEPKNFQIPLNYPKIPIFRVGEKVVTEED